jgi:hypothetical protein
VDCNDGNNAVYPGATENCNGIDDNCVNGIDEGCAVTAGNDSDGDGIPDSIEESASGFELSSEFELWTGSVWDNSQTITIQGAGECSPGDNCLNPFRPDLFVIWRPLTTGSLIDLTTCNIFEFASNPIAIGGANYRVWMLRERPGVTTATRRIAEDTIVSTQKAALLIEDSSVDGSYTGISQPATIMVDGKGKALIRTHKIQQSISDNCGDPCSIAGVGSLDLSAATCRYCKKIAVHEIWHVLAALNSPDLHIANEDYIMSAAVIYTDGTAFIGDEFSAAGQNDPRFQ